MDHKELKVWQKSMEFVKNVYEITEQFPGTEIYGLTSQLRRAAVSIPSNIAEGSARSSDRELIQFLYIAIGSMAEVETQLILARELGFVKNIDRCLETLVEIRKMTSGLITYLKNKL